MKLIEPIQKALVKSGYTTATPIQAQAIPQILEGKDLFGIAQTGTGKTAAFTLPILQLMFNTTKKYKSTRTLILTPTRELAAQIGDSIKEYGSFTNFRHTVIFGGVAQGPQEQALRRGADIIIATPGRLLDLMQQRLVDFKMIEYFILDEADRMLDMGFINDIKKVIAKLPKQRQSLFFSATMSPTISQLAKNFLINPSRVEVTPQATTIEKIDQGLYFVDKDNKDKLLLDTIKNNKIRSVIVFTRTKHKANKIVAYLAKNNIKAAAIHGNKSQAQRTNALDSFKAGKITALIATDIVARGIDIDNVSHVINYELPVDIESYVHRIGRTARAGNEGIAYSFCCAEERNFLREIESLIKQKIPIVKHDKHSDIAQNAKGAAARPVPKVKQQRKTRPLNKKINIGEEKKKFLNSDPKKKKFSNNKTNNNNK